MDTKVKRKKITKNYSLKETIKVLGENNIELLEEIIENQPRIVSERENENSLLHYAIVGNNEEIIDLLINKGSDIEARNYLGATPLHIAILRCNLNLIKFLVDKEAHRSKRTLAF